LLELSRTAYTADESLILSGAKKVEFNKLNVGKINDSVLSNIPAQNKNDNLEVAEK
jgi:hypothetical protein